MTQEEGFAQFYTVQQVASILQVCRATVYRLIQGDKLAAYRIGRGSYRIPRAAFSDFLSTCTTASATSTAEAVTP